MNLHNFDKEKMSEKIGKQPPLKLKSAKINPGYPVVFDMLLIEVRIKIDDATQLSTLFIKKRETWNTIHNET